MGVFQDNKYKTKCGWEKYRGKRDLYSKISYARNQWLYKNILGERDFTPSPFSSIYKIIPFKQIRLQMHYKLVQSTMIHTYINKQPNSY